MFRLLWASKIWSGANRSDVVLDRCHWGVVADRASHDARAAWDELSEDRVQAFVGLVACPVGVRHHDDAVVLAEVLWCGMPKRQS